MTKRILTILTSHDALGSTGRPTGFWLEEFVTPLLAFQRAGLKVDVASVRGGRPPVDPGSADFDASGLADLDAILDGAIPLESVDPAGYDAVFLVGGHGTMWDFPANEKLAAIVSAVSDAGIVAAVCHGVAGLLDATTATGMSMVAGRTLTGFSDAEEAMVGVEAVIPFSVQQRLAALGAVVEVEDPFTPTVRRDGRLITGQNPASSAGVADALVEALAGS